MYCGVQKGHIDSSRLCNQGLRNREMVPFLNAVFCLVFLKETVYKLYYSIALEKVSVAKINFHDLHIRNTSVALLSKVYSFTVHRTINISLCGSVLLKHFETLPLQIIRGGGCVVGRVDEEGHLSGSKLAYIYPDFKTALFGTFKDGLLVSAQEVEVTGSQVDYRCIQVPPTADQLAPGAHVLRPLWRKLHKGSLWIRLCHQLAHAEGPV